MFVSGTAEILEDRGGGKSPNSIISLDYWLWPWKISTVMFV